MTAELTAESLKVLIVDDQPMSCKQLERTLKDHSLVHIDQALTVPAALDKIKENAYDVIFIDWYMPPGKSGYQLLQQLREDRAYDNLACVMVSAEMGQHFISEALKSGANAYLIKPVTGSVLKTELPKIIDWLGRRRSLQK